jgi:hypothetical protein
MSIKTQVDDAIFLYENNRHLGALTNLLLAVAGSSAKIFPEGTLNTSKPVSKKGKFPEMTDGERFGLFLGGRLRKIANNETGSDDVGSSGIRFSYKGEAFTIEHILYKFYRCKLAHESSLPADIEFVSDFGSHRPNYVLLGNYGPTQSASFACHSDKLLLNYGWIPLLIDVVSKAYCNRDLFGVLEPELLPKTSGFDEQTFKTSLYPIGNLPAYPAASSFFPILKSVAKELNPAVINSSNDQEINLLFSALVQSGTVVGGAVTGLVTDELVERNRQTLTAKGIAVLREIANNYDLK